MTQPITLQTLTPLHIGSGYEYAGNFEFVHFKDAQKIAIVDDKLVLNLIGKDNLEAWIEVIEKRQNLHDFLKIYKSDLKATDIARYTIAVRNAPTDQQAIKQYMRDGLGNAYIAGSSLKGAIRTSILTTLIKKQASFVQNQQNLGVDNRNGFRFDDAKMQANYLGADAKHDLLRFLHISDFHLALPTETECLKRGIMNLHTQGWGFKRDQYDFVECLPAHTEARGTIAIPDTLKDLVAQKSKQNELKGFPIQAFEQLDIAKIFTSINAHTLALLRTEIAFWEDEDINEDIEEYLAVLNDMEARLQTAGKQTCIIRLGAGSGWDFMTGGWAKAEDANGNFILDDRIWNTLKRSARRKPYPDHVTFPKTRKFGNYHLPFGFVQLSY